MRLLVTGDAGFIGFPRISFESGLSETVSCYRNHAEWWQAVKSRGAERRNAVNAHIRA